MADAEPAGAVAEPGAAAHPSGDTGHPPTGLNGPQEGAGAPADDWRQQIPASVRGDKLWSRHKDLPSVFLSYAEAEKRAGALIKPLGANATPEEVAAYRTALGVPKDASGYALPALEGLDEARWQTWAQAAHKLGLTPGQLEGLATLEAEERRTQTTAQRQAWTAGLEALREEWGKGRYDRLTTYATRAVDRFGTPELKAFLEQTGLGDHPELVKAWAAVGEIIQEHGYIEGRIEGVPGVDEAKRQIAEIRAQGKAHPANDLDHPQHAKAVDALAELYKLAYGTTG